MADSVTTQTLYDHTKRASFVFTNKSDGNGESAVVKIDASELTGNTYPANTRFDISNIQWNITTGDKESVELLWDATVDKTAMVLTGSGKYTLSSGTFAPIYNNALSGVTGDLKFTTKNFTANSSYTIFLDINKTLGYVGSSSS